MYKNTTIADCVWHNIDDDECSGDVSIILYADRRRQVVSTISTNIEALDLEIT